MVSIMSLLVEGLKQSILKSTRKSLNVDSSFNIENKLLKCSMLNLYVVMQSSMSHILYLGPIFCFM